MVSSPNLADKSWVTAQYDRYVQGNTVLAQPENSGMVRIDEETGLGVAIATDANGRYTKLDPYAGAQLALAEAYRNVAATGAQPLAVTNCLNFGSPEDPDVMWQFAEAVRGLADGCLALGVPVTGGNVSFYNQTAETAILPTPVVGVLGVITEVDKRTPMAFGAEGDVVLLLGDTRDELAGSEWAHVVHGHLGGLPPVVDLEAEHYSPRSSSTAPATSCCGLRTTSPRAAWRKALAEMAIKGDIGVRVEVGGRPVRRVVLGVHRPRGRRRVAVGRGGPRRARGVARGARHAARHRGRGCPGRRRPVQHRRRRAARGLGGHAARVVRPVCRLTPMARGKEVDLAAACAALDGQWALLRSWVAELPRSEYAVPSVLDGWTVGDLVGHVSRTLLLFETLEPASGAVTPLTIGGYVSAYAGVADEIRDRAVDTAAEIAGDPLAALDATWATRRPLIDGAACR